MCNYASWNKEEGICPLSCVRGTFSSGCDKANKMVDNIYLHVILCRLCFRCASLCCWTWPVVFAILPLLLSAPSFLPTSCVCSRSLCSPSVSLSCRASGLRALLPSSCSSPTIPCFPSFAPLPIHNPFPQPSHCCSLLRLPRLAPSQRSRARACSLPPTTRPRTPSSSVRRALTTGTLFPGSIALVPHRPLSAPVLFSTPARFPARCAPVLNRLFPARRARFPHLPYRILRNYVEPVRLYQRHLRSSFSWVAVISA